ncbi:MAG: hypothetical protein WCC81_15165 [Pseudolabrys sp.]
MTTTDRANVVVTAVLQTICEALRADPTLRAALAELLADEIDDAVREAVQGIRLKDD